jgi:hypothetical protein
MDILENLKKDYPPYPKMKEGLHIKLINNHMEGSCCHHLMEDEGVGSHAAISSAINVLHEVFMALQPTNARRRNRKHCISNWEPSPLQQFRGEPTQS